MILSQAKFSNVNKLHWNYLLWKNSFIGDTIMEIIYQDEFLELRKSDIDHFIEYIFYKPSPLIII